MRETTTKILLVIFLCLFTVLSTAEEVAYQRQGKSLNQKSFSSSEKKQDCSKDLTSYFAESCAQKAVPVYFTSDFLWWYVKEDGLEFATKGISELNVPTSDPPVSSIKEPNWNWDPGFKVGIGTKQGKELWDFLFQYTWIYSQASRNNVADLTEDFSSPSSDNRLLPLWVIGGVGGNQFRMLNPLDSRIRTASGKWNLHFNVFDLELGKKFFFTKHISFHPFFGLKGTLQKQHYVITYEDRVIDFGSRETNDFLVKQVQRIWGIGIQAGVNSAWRFAKSWSLFSDFDISPLLTRFHIRRKDKRTRFLETNQFANSGLYFNVKHTFYALKAVLEFNLGVRGEYQIGHDDNYHLLFQLAWEEQLWFNQNNFIDRLRSAHGDLTLQGLTMKAQFSF